MMSGKQKNQSDGLRDLCEILILIFYFGRIVCSIMFWGCNGKRSKTEHERNH